MPVESRRGAADDHKPSDGGRRKKGKSDDSAGDGRPGAAGVENEGGERLGQPGVYPPPVDPKHWPKKHVAGALKRGDTVWYRGERFWIESVPADWKVTCYARISSIAVHPDPLRALPTNRTTLCVHADLLSLAPAAKSIYHKPPSEADVARSERARAGQRDIGDEVATLLREAGDLDAVYAAGAKFLGCDVASLKSKYGHLNPGQQRMNVGNKMRHHAKKQRGDA